ncbi:ATP-binding protein [Actinophytocola xanthii]|uniref:SARP family transcriptional regulator n=1 Tax=Actinophytocola xanthii TaxID=1912961 RepID=A0A1Q8CRR9_9PSEU|nr:tetratricopeptide repeat protein [Actinophytocola xanthii]OLF17046.1 SARP family transcriptional regulator [Actinophytocola xanthii]
MAQTRPAVHRTIVVVDIENFGDPRRTSRHQLAMRDGLYTVVPQAIEDSGVPWADCDHEDRGDGMVVLVPGHLPKTFLVDVMPGALVAGVLAYNRTHAAAEQLRLRLALHAGEVTYDDHGVTGAAVTLTFRLVDAAPLRTALAESPGVLAMITSGWFFEEVVRQSHHTDPATFRPVPVEVKKTSTTGWLSLPDHPYPAEPTAPVDRPGAGRVPRQLPAPPRSFTGRTAELAALSRAVEPGRGLVLQTISGAGGIGKTWLALRWAHDNADRFTDGQLFVDLRGFSPTGAPMSPSVALRGFLQALGIHPAEVPRHEHAQAGLFRSLVAGRRLLIVLDNAATTEQVTPLLPGSATCVVLVTSRSRLPGLAAAHGARHVPLGVLDDDQAHTLLAARVGTARTAAEPAAAADLVGFCQGFPLALSIVAARAETCPEAALADLATDLRELGLEALDSADPAASLPAVLSWSHRALRPDQATAFELVALAPGPDIGLSAATALLGSTPGRTRTLLRDLHELSLLDHNGHRYQLHDLVRRYATEHPDLGTVAGRNAALRRVVDFYLGTTHAADHLLDPHRESPPAGCSAPLPLPDEETALAWLDSEHACLLAAQRLAADRGWHRQAAHFALVLHTYHWRRGRLDDQVAVGRVGLESAARTGDPTAHAMAYRHLAEACALMGRRDEAVEHLRPALRLAERTGDRTGQAHTHRILAWADSEHGDVRTALGHITLALRLFQEQGDEEWEARALNQTAWYSALLGQHDQAQAHADRALLLHRCHRNTNGTALALAVQGYIAHRTGRHDHALRHCRQSLAMLEALRNTFFTALVLEVLGHVELALGHTDGAARYWRRSLRQYREQNRMAKARQVRALLDTLGRAGAVTSR